MLVHLTAPASDSLNPAMSASVTTGCHSIVKVLASHPSDGEADVEVDSFGLMVDPLPTGPTSCKDDITELEVDTFHGPLIWFAIVTSIGTGVTVSSSRSSPTTDPVGVGETLTTC